MAATTNQAFWGFLWWIKHNRFKPDMSSIDEMAKQFAAVNTTLCTFSTTDPGSYGTLQFPKKGTTTLYATDTNGITAAQTALVCEQSLYPEQGV